MDTIKLPIYHIGVTKDGNNTTKIAILQKTCKGWIVCFCQSLLENEKALIPKKYFTSPMTFSLQGSDVLTKSSSSTLKNKKNILKVALTNFGMNSALPWESLVILPKLTPTTQKETITTLWISQKNVIQKQLSSLAQSQLFPSIISCRSTDLFFLAEQSFLKKLPNYFLVYSKSEETICLCVQNKAVLLSRSLSNKSAKKNCEDIYATLQHIKETFPTAFPTTIHFAQGSEALKKALIQKQDLPLTPCPLIPSHLLTHWEEYDDAIATALHGASRKTLKFRYETKTTPEAHKHWLKQITILISKLALLSTLIITCGSTIKLKILSNHTKKLYNLVCPEESVFPKSLNAAENLLKTIETQIPSTYPYQPTIATSEQVLKFLAALGQNYSTLKFSHFTYKLTHFPTEKNPTCPYTAEILLAGQGSSEEVSQFLKRVSKYPKLHHVSETQKDAHTFELRFNLSSQEIL
ncbi:hypothetical protein [Chlamydia sp. 17-3921]|uniref:hypothetical protein n=1 Tax=Chlamydia sp. 17-3921 TaxID=2675798 RepID=UPI001919A776|nr:hypothetical protein [Chlamydia sp. 17-3921]